MSINERTLSAGDVWITETFITDCFVINPVTDAVFQPKVTCIIDTETRLIVGHSVESDNKEEIEKALNTVMRLVGVPKIHYSDNEDSAVSRFLEKKRIRHTCDFLRFKKILLPSGDSKIISTQPPKMKL